MKKIAIFASGGGSNAKCIMEHFQHDAAGQVVLVVCNKKEAGVLQHAKTYGIPAVVISRSAFYESEALLDTLRQHEVDWVVLAGFLWLVPPYLVRAYKGRMLNIHPALLPKYGGKGMHGMHIHEAVHAAGESETGMTIHMVNEHYDEGAIVFQARCPVTPDDTPADIARNVLALEHRHYAPVIAQLIR
jgi:phosphoribosylglycinamide formyltransferase 1